jgi:glycosyltransferase involved in cell wall biosynthesis
VISFIVPAYNEEVELPETLRAIQSAASAVLADYEIIVVDDASIDRTAELARATGAQVIRIDRRQIAATRNAGARHAQGDILFFVDADTRIAPVHVRKATEALAAGYAGGSARMVLDRDVPWLGKFFLQLFAAIYYANNLGAGAFLFTTRRNFEAVNGFDEQYFAGEEVFLSLALKKLGPFKILAEPMVTSGRKLRMYSGRHLWREFIRMMLGGMNSYRSRDRLDIWYDGKRESSAG